MERLHVECVVHAAVAEDDGRVQLVEQLVVRDDRLQAVQDLLKNIMLNERDIHQSLRLKET